MFCQKWIKEYWIAARHRHLCLYKMYLHCPFNFVIVPRLSRTRGTLTLIRPSVRPSVWHKNFNLANIFWSIDDRALIFGMHDNCDRPFLFVPCFDLDIDLWPIPRYNLLPGEGPQFFEFACCKLQLHFPTTVWTTILRSNVNKINRKEQYHIYPVIVQHAKCCSFFFCSPSSIILHRTYKKYTL